MSESLPALVPDITILGGDSTDEILNRAVEMGGHLATLINNDRDTYLQEFKLRNKRTGITTTSYHPKLGLLQIITERFGFFLSVKQDSFTDIRDADGTWVGYRCYAELVDRDGVVRGCGQIGICTRDEIGKDAHTRSAILGMAQTRACSRVARMAFGWVLEMANRNTSMPLEISATPAEEMEAIESADVPVGTRGATAGGAPVQPKPQKAAAAKSKPSHESDVVDVLTPPSKSEWRIRCQNGEQRLREFGRGAHDFEAWRVERFGKEFITSLIGAPEEQLQAYHTFLVTQYHLAQQSETIEPPGPPDESDEGRPVLTMADA